MQSPDLSFIHGPLDSEQQKQRYAHAGYRVNKDGGNGLESVSFVRTYISGKAHDHFMVIGAAYDTFICQIVHVG